MGLHPYLRPSPGLSRWGALVLIPTFSLMGCATAHNLGIGHGTYYDHPRIYGAVRIDVIHFMPEEFPLGALIGLVDLPFSIAFDTLTLPWSIPATIEHGDADPWPERTPPTAIVEGVIVRGDRSEYRIVPAEDVWRNLPAELEPLSNVKVKVLTHPKEPDRGSGADCHSNVKGHFSLISSWEPPWKVIRIESDEYETVEIPVSKLHDPTDHNYWSGNRILVRMARR